MTETKHAQHKNRIYSIPVDASLETALKAKTAKYIRKAKPNLDAFLFCELWERADDFDGFCDLVAKEGDQFYFTPSSAKQRASKYRAKGVPLKKYPPKSRGIEPLPYDELRAQVLKAQAKKK